MLDTLLAKNPPAPSKSHDSTLEANDLPYCAPLKDRRCDVASGIVKWFNPTKGYGFVQPSDGGKDVFVHISAVEKAGLSSLNEGQQISYDIVSNRGKESAENIKVK
jgi:CspA family cold shock protein